MTILIVAAHPDDEILGCGGAIARFIREGHEVVTLILGEGITSRDNSRDDQKRSPELERLKDEAQKANELLGVKKVFFQNFSDNRFDAVPLLDIVKEVDRIKKEVSPEIIFTHYKDDLNIDHRITYQAVLTTTRPLPEETVKEIYSFEILSSTEWNFPLSFSPDVFFDISSSINQKLEALAQYKGELKEYPHPRSLEGVKLNAKYWGMKMSLEYVEAFKLVRLIK